MKRVLIASLIGSLLVAATTTRLCADVTVLSTPEPATTPAPAKKARVGLIKLSDALIERPASFKLSLSDLSGDHKPPVLSSLIVTLNKAAKDSTINGIVFDLSSFSLSLSQAQELGGLMQNLRKAGKRVAVYASDYDTATYILASYADTVIMPENGNVLIPGVALNMLFFKGTLDKLHMQPDFIQVGKFKGAEEPFMRSSASPEYRAQIQKLVDGMYDQVISTIAANRPNIEEGDVKKAVDAAWINGKRAKELGLVDQTITRDRLESWVDSQFPAGAALIADYGQPPKKSIEMDSPFALLSLFGDKPKARSRQPAIAVIYAVGEIVPDFVGGEDSTDMVTPGAIRNAVDIAIKDDLVKAIVLRVDSPGGSASASDEIWSVLKEADKKKPVTVSMGRVAASGGYYIACSGRSITADPATITGSIGVVAGKIVIKGATENIGINVETISRGQHAGMLSMMQPFSDEERSFLQKSMEETYGVFTDRVKGSRGDKVAHLEEVAQGRLFTGMQAKEVGLVDRVATLNETVLTAAESVKIEKNFQIIVLPETKTFADILREGFSADAKAPITLKLDPIEVAIASLPADVRVQARSMSRMMKMLGQEHMLMALPGLTESH